MAVKIRNAANDASVTLIDGGGVGSPIIDIDVRNLFQNVQTAGDTMTGALEVPAGATGVEAPQVQEVEQMIATAVATAIAALPPIPTIAPDYGIVHGNGWTKFPDGTLIQQGEDRQSVYRPTVHFPVHFVHAPVVTIAVYYGDTTANPTQYYSAQLTKGRITNSVFAYNKHKHSDGTASTDAFALNWIAIGKWK